MARAIGSDRTILPIDLGDGVKIRAEVTHLDGRSKATVGEALPFSEFATALGRLSSSLVTGLRRCSPNRASVELGLELGVESGRLTVLLAKGTHSASLKVTLEWSETSASPASAPQSADCLTLAELAAFDPA